MAIVYRRKLEFFKLKTQMDIPSEIPIAYMIRPRFLVMKHLDFKISLTYTANGREKVSIL